MRIMAIPAEIRFAVRFKIDARNFFGAVGPLGMAFSADFPIGRFPDSDRARILPVIGWSHVAIRTSQSCVMRDHFPAGNFPMASAAIFGRMREKRIMGIMTGHTGPAGIMKFRNYLRKTGGARRIIAVTEDTKLAITRGGGNEFIRGTDMFDAGAMADLARQTLMI
jgi:hypothetical protein